MDSSGQPTSNEDERTHPRPLHSTTLTGAESWSGPFLCSDGPAPKTAELGGQTVEPATQPGPPPRRIGRYRIEGVLGRGGFGIVYLARDEQLDRLVAVKVPHAERIALPEQAEMYRAEARTVAALEHSHIVPVYDVGSTDEHPFFVVSKYVEGTDLAT